MPRDQVADQLGKFPRLEQIGAEFRVMRAVQFHLAPDQIALGAADGGRGPKLVVACRHAFEGWLLTGCAHASTSS